MGRRRGRRRAERSRAKHQPQPKRSWATRLSLVVIGLLMTAGGLGLLLGGTGPERVFRVAGILIVVGIVLVGVGIVGG